jgi:hypothetical protein
MPINRRIPFDNIAANCNHPERKETFAQKSRPSEKLEPRPFTVVTLSNVTPGFSSDGTVANT